MVWIFVSSLNPCWNSIFMTTEWRGRALRAWEIEWHPPVLMETGSLWRVMSKCHSFFSFLCEHSVPSWRNDHGLLWHQTYQRLDLGLLSLQNYEKDIFLLVSSPGCDGCYNSKDKSKHLLSSGAMPLRCWIPHRGTNAPILFTSLALL